MSVKTTGTQRRTGATQHDVRSLSGDDQGSRATFDAGTLPVSIVAPHIGDVRSFVGAATSHQRSVGLVPTLGALHDGHLALIRTAREQCDHVIVSIFVNPLQFNEKEDFARYPRQLESDLELLERGGVDLVFVPGQEEMYPNGEPVVTVDPGPLGLVLEGATRPGHFRGVATVVAKLLAIACADRAFFGEKDYQQLTIIRQLVQELCIATEIVACETVRDDDGCALSSRNALLSSEDRRAAAVLHAALVEGRRLIENGESSPTRIEVEMAAVIRSEPRASLDYAVLRGADQLELIERCAGRMRLLVAANFGAVRLIDNLGVES